MEPGVVEAAAAAAAGRAGDPEAADRGSLSRPPQLTAQRVFRDASLGQSVVVGRWASAFAHLATHISFACD